MPSRHLYAIIAGVGPGAGASIARKFAQDYAVVLLARNSANLEPVAQEITKDGGVAISMEGDVTKPETIQHAFEAAEGKLGADSRCAAAIFNASARPAFKSFLELSESEFVTAFNVSCVGGFHFAQAVIPKLLDSSPKQERKYPPTLIFTGATASMRGGKMLSSFAVGKTATRTMAQSIAREFGPKGLHVSHVIIDGVIDIPSNDGTSKDKSEGKIDPDTIADTYWYLHTQPQSGFTHELEIRPSGEKW